METINFIIALSALIIVLLVYQKAINGKAINSLKEQVDSLRETAAKALEKVEETIRPQKQIHF